MQRCSTTAPDTATSTTNAPGVEKSEGIRLHPADGEVSTLNQQKQIKKFR